MPEARFNVLETGFLFFSYLSVSYSVEGSRPFGQDLHNFLLNFTQVMVPPYFSTMFTAVFFAFIIINPSKNCKGKPISNHLQGYSRLCR